MHWGNRCYDIWNLSSKISSNLRIPYLKRNVLGHLAHSLYLQTLCLFAPNYPLYILLAMCKTTVSPLATHWRYCSFVLSKEFEIHKYTCSPALVEENFMSITLLIEALWEMHAQSNWVIIDSGNISVPVWHQSIFWTNDNLLSVITNSSEIWIKMLWFSFKKQDLKMLFAKWQPFLEVSICLWWAIVFSAHRYWSYNDLILT